MTDPDGEGRARVVLLVDDDTTQLKLSAFRLREAGFDVVTATSAENGFARAKLRRPDAIVSDVLMGGVDGFGFCVMLNSDPELTGVPVILLSAHYHGKADEELAARVGAFALVLRTPEFESELAVLRRCLACPSTPHAFAPDPALDGERLRTNANQLQRLAAQVKSVSERYRMLFENATDAISVLTPKGIILEVNGRWRDVMGVPAEALIGRNIREFAPQGAEDDNDERYRDSIATGAGRLRAFPVRRKDGSTIFMEFSLTVVEIEGMSVVFSIGHDVTSSLAGTRALARAEEKYRSLIERIPDVVWTLDDERRLAFITPNIEALTGYGPNEVGSLDFAAWLARVHADDVVAVRAAYDGLAASGQLYDLEYRFQRRDGTWVWIRDRAIAAYERDGRRFFDGMSSDVTERKRLEESFRQSQKMEAIGQLTGGIAHDFNNILSVILANGEFLAESLLESDPRRVDAEEIVVAAERAAALTRQLLAFSRKQVLEPKTVDLNVAMNGLEKMLQRVIGADIAFGVIRAPELGSVRVDIGQLEQVVMNLVVNARDAMPLGGTLTIETSNVEIDGPAAEALMFFDVPPGRYVMLTVTDSGCGMDVETKRRVFEPFYTTKEVGRGTGLGLSTCYGIVKQSGGHIHVYSELGHGTVFKIYLPRVDRCETGERASSPDAAPGGRETILLVEDDDAVRAVVARMLEARGYRLLLASSGAEAIELSKRGDPTIDLVVSDVIMPGSSGPDVIDQVRADATSARVLFMSGYTDHAIFERGALIAGAHFIQKPFAPEALARKVREILDAPLA